MKQRNIGGEASADSMNDWWVGDSSMGCPEGTLR